VTSCFDHAFDEVAPVAARLAGTREYLLSGQTMFAGTPGVDWVVFTDCADYVRRWGQSNVKVVATSVDDVRPTERDMAAINSKVALALRALEQQCVHTAATWVDFGVLRHVKGNKKKQEFCRDVVAMGQLTCHDLFIPGFHPPAPRRLLSVETLATSGISWTFVGDMFYGALPALRAFHTACEAVVQHLHGRTTWDVLVWHQVACATPGLVTYCQLRDHSSDLPKSILRASVAHNPTP
jgi:hypothetical protein